MEERKLKGKKEIYKEGKRENEKERKKERKKNIEDPKVKLKLATVVEGDQKASFSIAYEPMCWGGRYSFPWIAPLYPLPYCLFANGLGDLGPIQVTSY